LEHYNSLHSALTLEASKVINVAVYCEQIAVKRLLYSVQYQIFNNGVCKWFINPFSNRSYQPESCGCRVVTRYSDAAESILIKIIVFIRDSLST